MITNNTSPSPAVLAANERLYALRQQRQIERPSPSQAQPSQQPTNALPPWESPRVPTEISTAVEQVKDLPSHLGWGSDAVTKSIRAAWQRQYRDEESCNPLTANCFNLCADINDTQPSSSLSGLTAKTQNPLLYYIKSQSNTIPASASLP